MLVIIVVICCGALATTSAFARAPARNPVSQADWKVWQDIELETVYRTNKIAPRLAVCGKIKQPVSIGRCQRKPLATLARLITRYSSVIRRIARRTRRGLCRTAALRYSAALRANLSANLQINQRLLADDIAGAQAALKRSSRTKGAEQRTRARARGLCSP